jgi:hypothetical protein
MNYAVIKFKSLSSQLEDACVSVLTNLPHAIHMYTHKKHFSIPERLLLNKSCDLGAAQSNGACCNPSI